MRLRSDLRAGRLLGRFPRLTAVSAVEWLLLVLIAVQAARLVWVLVTPLGPVGDYRASALAVPAGAAPGDFDPFFRLVPAGGPAAVTALNLKLYGVREDRATGRGSAIIGLPDGSQLSFAVGEEVMPGVRLAQVGFDSVTIDRNGVPEQIFLDQSEPAPTVPGAASAAPAAPVVVPAAPTAAIPSAAVSAPAAAAPPVRLQPRMRAGRIDGITVSPGAAGAQAFRTAGFEPGDVIVSIDGARVTSVEQARALIGRAGPATVVVERDGRAVPIIVRLDP